jgi:hypothetical protein
LTLVIHPSSPDQKTYWAVSSCQNLAEARENLRSREGGTNARHIHSLTSNGQTQGDMELGIADKIREWLATHSDIEAAIWTGLPSNWQEKRKTEFKPERAVAYLHELEMQKDQAPETYNRAQEYVTNTPRQIQTPVRGLIQHEQAWADANLSDDLFESTVPKICIVGTPHAHQLKIKRRGYLQNVESLIQIHSVDLVAEEASGVTSTYAKEIADGANVAWMNVDLTSEERKHVPDLNPDGIGTQIDFDLHWLREWVWVIRTAKAMKKSALLICGYAHTTGTAEKFWSLGFDVETHVYFDRRDERLFESRIA